MKKWLSLFSLCILFCFSSTIMLSAQLRLKVEGDSQLSGDLKVSKIVVFGTNTTGDSSGDVD